MSPAAPVETQAETLADTPARRPFAVEPAEVRAHHVAGRTGVLLVNLGTPDAPTAPAIRRYLREFLSDTRVVDLFRPVWWLILNLAILPFRPRRLAHAYASVWEAGPGGGASPLLAITRRQGVALQAALGSATPVGVAMRYGNPSVASTLRAMRDAGVRRFVVLPLYPQYSGSTSASTMDAVWAEVQAWTFMPDVHARLSYADHPAYIEALARSVEVHWRDSGRQAHLLMSFHGIPRRYFLAGDPYPCHCHRTARLLAGRLGLLEGAWSLSFQSQFGREPWLTPATDKHVQRLVARGVKSLDVICPGFAADCLETLEEVAMTYHDTFVKAGGPADGYRYIPALNDSPMHITMLRQLVEPAMASWATAMPDDGGPGGATRIARALAVAPALLRDEEAPRKT